MNSKDSRHPNRQLADEARRQYQAQRIKRLASLPFNALAEPTVAAIVDPGDGTLDVRLIDQDLDVGIPEWPNIAEGDTVQLYIKRHGSNESIAVSESIPVDESTTFPLNVPMDQAHLEQEGAFDLFYKQMNADGNSIDSAPRPLRVDRTPPWGHQYPEKLVLPAAPITDAYLKQNPQGVTGTIPEYEDSKSNDKVAVYYFNELPPDSSDDLPDPILLIDVPANRQITISEDDVRTYGDGGCYVVYVLIDIAGNASRISTYTALDVALGTLPSGMGDPVVPLAAPDNLVDLEDARTGVLVEIPAFENWKSTDTLIVSWGNTPLPREQIGSSPHFPLEVRMPAAALKAEYTDAPDRQSTRVSYELFRGTMSQGTLDTEVDVDFSVIGPVRPDPDPDWPGGNANLPTLEVRGKTSDQANTLTREDENQPALITLIRYTGAKDGERIQFYWKGEHVPEADLTIDTEEPAELTAEIPWEYIYNARNDPQLPVHYGITAPGETNEEHSLATLVNANAVVLRAPAVKFERTFKRADGTEVLNCNSLWDPNDGSKEPAFLVTIPDLTNLGVSAGHVLKITWTALKGESGDTQVAELFQNLTIGTDLPTTGGRWEIKPYDEKIYPIYDGANRGRGRVDYEISGGAETINALSAEISVSIFNGGGSCEIPSGA
ncbi:hypothetical protein [Pseudomonas juntendi]|uniref:hypothetical protein n=1 Tax=Pseudomonas juntendi TaxID=2666183 RepID=UPI001B8207F9|nr:hypothetical protein [Pseudomonas juntendi]MBR7522594.1 hypothetical protein [Pseudomonas juntendi]